MAKIKPAPSWLPCEPAAIPRTDLVQKEVFASPVRVNKFVLIPAIKASLSMVRDAIAYPFTGGTYKDGTATGWMVTISVGSGFLLPIFLTSAIASGLPVFIIGSILTAWYSIPPLLRVSKVLFLPLFKGVGEKFEEYFSTYQQKMLNDNKDEP